MSEHVKVHVTFANAGEQDGPPVGGEYIWAKTTDVPNHYVLNNIPFFADFGLGDTVHTIHATVHDMDYDREITHVVKPSGNLTVRLFFTEDVSEDQRREIGRIVRDYEGCGIEWANPRLLAASISPHHTAERVLGEFIKSGAAICDLFSYDDTTKEYTHG